MYMFTTYTYEELKGLSQIEDPAGRKLFYEYTDDGKLECIKDNKGNIINQYEYHFSFHIAEVRGSCRRCALKSVGNVAGKGCVEWHIAETAFLLSSR